MRLPAAMLSASLLFASLTACSEPANAQNVPASPSPSFTSVLAAKRMKIMAVGDSITVGVDGIGYRDDLAALLKAQGVEVVWVVAAANSAPCTAWSPLLAGLVATNRPDVVLLNCGTNDVVTSDAQLRGFANMYGQMINDVRGGGAKLAVSKLQISRVVGNPRLAYLPANEAKINKVIDRASKFYGDVGCADLSLIAATVENNPDGVHPGPIGERLYAEAWFDEGRRLGWW